MGSAPPFTSLARLSRRLMHGSTSMATAIYPWRDAQIADMPPVRLNKEGDALMPVYTAQPEDPSRFPFSGIQPNIYES